MNNSPENLEPKIEKIKVEILTSMRGGAADLEILKKYYTDPEIAPLLDFGETSLTSKATIYGHREVVEFLLAGENNLNRMPYAQSNISLALSAATHNHFSMIDLFMTNEKINEQIDWNQEGPHALLYCLLCNPAHEEMFIYLVKRLDYNPETLIERMTNAEYASKRNRENAIQLNMSLIEYAMDQKKLFNDLNEMPDNTPEKRKNKI